MSEVTSILTGRINLKRLTSFLLDVHASSGSPLPPTRQPLQSSRLIVEVIGATVSTGIVTIVGSTTEVFSFSQNGAQIGSKNFTSLTSITFSGIGQGFIQVRAVNNMGQNTNQEITVSSNVPVRFFTQQGRIKTFKPGEQQVAVTKIMTEPTLDIQNLDNIYVLSGLYGITVAQLDFVEALFDFDGATHHMEAVIKQP